VLRKSLRRVISGGQKTSPELYGQRWSRHSSIGDGGGGIKSSGSGTAPIVVCTIRHLNTKVTRMKRAFTPPRSVSGMFGTGRSATHLVS